MCASKRLHGHTGPRNRCDFLFKDTKCNAESLVSGETHAVYLEVAKKRKPGVFSLLRVLLGMKSQQFTMEDLPDHSFPEVRHELL